MQVSELLFSRGYRLGPRIGKGSYAKVKIAERVADNRIMAAKIVSRRKTAKEFLNKFLPRELSIILSLDHRNIIQVFEIVQTEDTVCVLMEFADRGDLLDYIKRRGALKEDEAGRVFAQICEGVGYLHERNMCHRDLKCENILLRKDMSVALSDFGFSRHLPSRDALSSTYCGSAAYVSPDLLRGTPYKPLENDIWSLGCILFITVTGQMPFYDKNTKKMMYRQLKGKVNFPEHRAVSLNCKDLISRTLQPNSELRFDIQAVIAHPWLQPFVLLVKQGLGSQISYANQLAHVSDTMAAASSSTTNTLNKMHAGTVSSLCEPVTQNLDSHLKPTLSSNIVSERSVGTTESDEQSNSMMSDNTSLCRMPGEACIIHGNRESQCLIHNEDPAGVSPYTSNTSDDQGDIKDMSFGTNPSSSSYHSSFSLEQDTSAVITRTPARHDSPQSSKVATPKSNLKKTADTNPDHNFKITIQKILQIPISKINYSKGYQDQQAAPPSCSTSCKVGKSLSGSQQSAFTGNCDVAQTGSQMHVQKSTNQSPIHRPPLSSAHTSTLPKLSGHEVSVEKTHMYQEGLVKQMLRIFESKDASTVTSGRPTFKKKS